MQNDYNERLKNEMRHFKKKIEKRKERIIDEK